MCHAGDEGMFQRTIVGPSGKDFVDSGVMDCIRAVGRSRYRQTLPLHAGVEHPQDKVEETMVAEFAPGSTFGHGEVG
jgi:hypothetical protein